MMKTSFPFTLGLPLGAVLALLGTHQAQDSQEAAAPKEGLVIGVVDFVKVFENYSKYSKAKRELDDLRQQHQASLDKEAARLDELEITIKKLGPETRERAELELQYKLLSDQLKGMRGIYEVDIQRGEVQALVAGYADIDKAIAQVAKDKGVDLVLRRRTDPDTESVLVRQRAYEQRNVWYASENLDLTTAVINLLKVLPAGQGGEK